MKPEINLTDLWEDGDGYVLCGAAVQALKDAGKDELVQKYISELLSDAWSYEHALRITQKYCILKNLKGGVLCRKEQKGF